MPQLPVFPNTLTVLLLFLLLFLFFLFFLFNLKQAVHVGLDRLQFLVFLPQPFEILIGGFFLCQQISVLRLQHFDGRQFFHTQGIKRPLRRFMQKQICFMGCPKRRFIRSFGFPISQIGIPGLGIVDDMRL